MEKQFENLLILELCKIKTYRKEKIMEWMELPLDYPYILGHLLYNRLGGAAYYIFRQCGLLGSLNREFRNTLKAVYKSNCLQAESFKTGLSQLSELLKEATFPYAILKGGYLVSLYEAGIRTSNDYDILVGQDDITALSKLLKKCGYRQGNIREGYFVPASRMDILSSRINRGETVPFIRETGLPQMRYSEVDINFSLDFKAKQEKDMVPLLLKHAEKRIKTSYGWMYTLDKADFFIQLCTHLFKEATVINWVRMGRDISLYKYMDICLFLTEFPGRPFAEKLIERIREYALERECYYALFYTRELFGSALGELDWILHEIKPEDTSFLKQIISPAEDKIYTYSMPYEQWIFCADRGGYLYEITNAGT